MIHCFNGHGYSYDCNQCLLINEHERETKYFKFFKAEEFIRDLACNYQNSYHVVLFNFYRQEEESSTDYISGDPTSPHPLAKAYSTQSSHKTGNALAEFSMSFRKELPALQESEDEEDNTALIRQDSALARVRECENFCFIFRQSIVPATIKESKLVKRFIDTLREKQDEANSVRWPRDLMWPVTKY